MPPNLLTHLILALVAVSGAAAARRHPAPANFTASGNPVYIWPLPKNFTSGTQTLAVDPDLALDPQGACGGAAGALLDAQVLTMKNYIKFIANTIYGAIRGLETFSQLCVFNYDTKNVEVRYAPWYIQDEPRFAFRGLMLDTSRHYLPVDVIKQVIDSMSFSKLIPSYPNLWKGSYSKSERYTVEDARYIVRGNGYPKLWPSLSCTEPLDVSSNFTFEVITGILSDMRKIFPFGLFHLGGDEVYTGCWNLTPHVKQWLDERNMTTKDAYKYFVLKAQEIAIDLNWIPVNWLGPGVCPKVVAKGLRCIMSNQGVWYLDHLDVPWEQVYTAEPLAGIDDTAQQKLVLGGEELMCRYQNNAERMWSQLEAISAQDLETTVLARLHYFRCLLNHRGIAAAPVTNFYARRPPIGPGSCFVQ
uniref:beta-N-acetylhexosaminidase n=1 Tax=Aegilops tauschii TaxID=37682 RepID=N1R591_AEGTA